MTTISLRVMYTVYIFLLLENSTNSEGNIEDCFTYRFPYDGYGTELLPRCVNSRQDTLVLHLFPSKDSKNLFGLRVFLHLARHFFVLSSYAF